MILELHMWGGVLSLVLINWISKCGKTDHIGKPFVHQLQSPLGQRDDSLTEKKIQQNKLNMQNTVKIKNPTKSQENP